MTARLDLEGGEVRRADVIACLEAIEAGALVGASKQDGEGEGV